MAGTAIARQRLAQQRLTQNPLADPAEIVAWLGAVQAQDYLGAKWTLGMRLQHATDAAIERAFNEGAILRTHVMRPTWHFVAPADIRWMLELTAPRVNAASAYMYRQLELDDALFSRSTAIIARALQGGQRLTRAEIGVALAQAGIAAEGMRLGYLIFRAELDGIACSGPRRGKQFTYALLDERAPHARSLPREAALAELTRRYFTGHGPATVRDFAWWSGLTIADANAGLEMAALHLAHDTIDSQTYWLSSSMSLSADPSQTAFLLPTYDEFLIGYDGFNESRLGGRAAQESAVFDSTIAIDGRIAGSWRRSFKRGTAIVEIKPFAPLAEAEREAVAAAIRRYEAFLEIPVIVQPEFVVR
jgi:hypothetical protein